MQIQIHLKSYHVQYLNTYIATMQNYLSQYEYTKQKQIFLPIEIKKYTVLRSPHVDKKARDQFECITHRRLIKINLNLEDKLYMLFLERFLSLIAETSIGVEVRLNYRAKV